MKTKTDHFRKVILRISDKELQIFDKNKATEIDVPIATHALKGIFIKAASSETVNDL
jgi:hypothetical protein